LTDRGGPGAASADRSPRVPLNQDWVRFRGEMNSEAFEEMLRKTPAERIDAHQGALDLVEALQAAGRRRNVRS